MRFVSLASGSKGNAALISTESTNVLIDCGISAKRADEELRALGLGLDRIDAVLVTHEHSDHIRGLKRLMSVWRIPVYATRGTLSMLSQATGDEYFDYAGRSLMEEVFIERVFDIGDISFLPFRIYHDVKEPCAYRAEVFQDGENLRKHAEVAVLTDCGHFDDEIIDHLCLTDAMIVEANHDIAMLKNGPYPSFLKKRILSDEGHLSNDAGSDLLARAVSPKLKSVFLGHLSQENNTHALALAAVNERLSEVYGEGAFESLEISVAPQNSLSRVVTL